MPACGRHGPGLLNLFVPIMSVYMSACLPLRYNREVIKPGLDQVIYAV